MYVSYVTKFSACCCCCWFHAHLEAQSSFHIAHHMRCNNCPELFVAAAVPCCFLLCMRAAFRAATCGCLRRRCCHPDVLSLPGRHFYNFRAFKTGDARTLCTSELLIDGFRSSKIVKGSAGWYLACIVWERHAFVHISNIQFLTEHLTILQSIEIFCFFRKCLSTDSDQLTLVNVW